MQSLPLTLSLSTISPFPLVPSAATPLQAETYTPAANFYGDVTISYAVTDPSGASTLASYTFNVASINDAPERVGAQLTLGGTQEDNSFYITSNQLLAGYTDADGDTLSVLNLALVDTSIGNLDGNPSTGWTFTPNPNWNGKVDLSYSVSDGNNGDLAVTNSFQIFAVNDAPINTTPAVSRIADGTEDQTLNFSAADLLSGFSDPESTTASLSIDGLSANNGTISGNAQNGYTFTPDTNFNGQVTLNYVVSDPDGGKTLASTSFSINPVNDAPVLTSGSFVQLANIQEDSNLVFSATQLLGNFSDVDMGYSLHQLYQPR